MIFIKKKTDICNQNYLNYYSIRVQCLVHLDLNNIIQYYTVHNIFILKFNLQINMENTLRLTKPCINKSEISKLILKIFKTQSKSK